MTSFKLTGKALRDVAEIISWLHREVDSASASKLEDRPFASFNAIAERRAPGHRRSDLTEKDLFFYSVHPYMIVFRKARGSIQIMRVAHGSRDLGKLL